MRKEGEVDLLEAMDMLDSPEEFFGKMVEAGKLKARRADGTIYFLRAQIEDLIDRQIAAVRDGGVEVGPGLNNFLLE
jgi:hypothetical protein